MRISAIVPTLNAAAHLGECLAALGDADELIVSDGGSTDGTRDLARRGGARVVEGTAGRGRQLAAGAAAASGNVLLFVHADTRLGLGWRRAAEKHLAGFEAPACFRLRLDDPAWQARAVETAVGLRTRLFALPYGDQGLMVRRDLYENAGGFSPLVLMEDVEILSRLPRVRMLDVDAVTSAERWRRDGWAHRSLRNLACLSLWKLGVSPERIAALYQPPPPASRTPRDRAEPAE